MAHSKVRTLRRRVIAIALALIVGGGGAAFAVAMQSSPAVRLGIADVIEKAAPPTSAFQETADHGFIATGQTVELSDDSLPAIANLDPSLLDAVRQAADAAGREQGIHIVATSGWRSSAYQGWLLSRAVARYGSAEEAAKWVSKPEDSRHVTGDAIDIGPFDGTLWMQSNASRFGLCQIYSNEPWHYELASAHDGSCPELRESAAT